jgi:hypothetical protein
LRVWLTLRAVLPSYFCVRTYCTMYKFITITSHFISSNRRTPSLSAPAQNIKFALESAIERGGEANI